MAVVTATLTGLLLRPSWELSVAFSLSTLISGFIVWVERDRKTRLDDANSKIKELQVKVDNITMALGIKRIA